MGAKSFSRKGTKESKPLGNGKASCLRAYFKPIEGKKFGSPMGLEKDENEVYHRG